jgi:hypothetical protein
MRRLRAHDDGSEYECPECAAGRGPLPGTSTCTVKQGDPNAYLLFPGDVAAMFGDESVTPLPHGSAFAVSYDAQAVRWSGTLTVTTPEGGKVFEGEAGAVFKLLSALDAQYREWLAGRAAPPAQQP